MMLVPPSGDIFFEDLHQKSSSLPSMCFRSVCRCLFGPVDHRQTKADLESLNDRLLNAAGERWNFDFRSGNPVHGGRYDWSPSKPKDPTEKTDEDSRLNFVTRSDSNQLPDNCDATAVNFNESQPPTNSRHVETTSASDVTSSRLGAPADVMSSRDVDSDVTDDFDKTAAGLQVTCRRRLRWEEQRVTSRSTAISGPARKTTNRRKTARKSVRTLTAQRSAITDYFPKTKTSSIEAKPGSRERHMATPFLGSKD